MFVVREIFFFFFSPNTYRNIHGDRIPRHNFNQCFVWNERERARARKNNKKQQEQKRMRAGEQAGNAKPSDGGGGKGSHREAWERNVPGA